MSTTVKNISDVISLSEVFSSFPTGLDKDFEDTLTLSDIFDAEFRSNLLNKDLEDTITISDIFGSETNDRTALGIQDNISIQDVFDGRVKLTPIKNLLDTILLSDTFVSIRTRAQISLDDVIVITDNFTADYPTNIYASIHDNVQISDDFVSRISEHFTRTFDVDQMTLTDTFLQQWGIIVNNGTGDGSYNIGEVVQLGATVPTGFTFLKWEFNKAGISNIYDPDATITIPYGGGVITATFVKTGSLVTILDIFDFEFVDNEDINDEIITNETATPTTGGFMGVANHNFEIPQGARFHNIMIYRDVNGNPVDLSGYTAEMHIRKFKADTDLILELNTSNGYLILGGALGTITIDTPGSITDILDFKWGYYDVELYPAGDVNNTIRILEGRIELSKQVTR